ncbi:MAG: nucleotidyltransferase domain-containing protein [Candidatus Aenigmarchaeota archaeon]|nr:nucleotidyltransferase domain-containing protein [Candidatus Aenigmarchaeota archaeon]
MKDQKQVQLFLKEFSSALAKEFGDDIDFILLFGSAARGEWKRGISDVDLVIQLKTKGRANEVSERAGKLFWALDKKHKTLLSKVCSIGADAKKDNVKKVLKKTRLYVPFEVFESGDLDWKNGKIKKKELILGANLVASQAMLFTKMKDEGKILYGRDIRKEICVKPSMWEKLKALLIPFYISSISVFAAPITPKNALKMANKAVMYSIEASLFFLEKPIGHGVRKAADELENELMRTIRKKYGVFGALELDIALNLDYRKFVHFDFVKEALRLKYNWNQESKKYTRTDTIKFCFRALFFVNSINWYVVLRKQ